MAQGSAREAMGKTRRRNQRFAPGAPAPHRAAPLRRMFEFGGEDEEAAAPEECSTDVCFEITFFKNGE